MANPQVDDKKTVRKPFVVKPTELEKKVLDAVLKIWGGSLPFQRALITGGSGFVGGYLMRLLSASGMHVIGMARSDVAAEKVLRNGGHVFRGHVHSVEALQKVCQQVDVIFHCAAMLDPTAGWERMYAVNVEGTRNIVQAAEQGRVQCFVHVSTEAVLVGNKIQNADESMPYAANIYGVYPRSKMMAEKVVWELCPPSQEASEKLEVDVKMSSPSTLRRVIIRPRFVWGNKDPTLLPSICEAIVSGDFTWISGGHYPTSTTHVLNVCEGILLASTQAAHGSTYFVCDGAPVDFRNFITQLVHTQEINTDRVGSMPHWLVKTFANVSDVAYSLLPLSGTPKITAAVVALIGEEVTVNDTRARNDLGYRAVISREEGVFEIRNTFLAGKK